MKKSLGIFLLLSSLVLSPAKGEEASVDNTFSNPGTLTDEQMYEAKTFNHQGYRDRTKEEACKKEGANCDINVLNNTGLMETLETNMGKAYTMIFGGLAFLNGGGPSVKLKEASKATPDAAKSADATKAAEGKKDNSTTDYCLYAAMGWEMLAMMIQTDLNGNIEQDSASIKDEQLRALIAVKKTHEARQRTATMQAVAYSAVTACYIAYATPLVGASLSDPTFIAKSAGAALLATLYWRKVAKESSAASAVQRVIKSLPDPGDCNPWTGTSCFCKEASSQKLYPNEYQTVCVLKTTDYLAGTPVPCGLLVNGKMQLDKQCKCKLDNSCFKPQVSLQNAKFDLGNNMVNAANQGFNLLGSGEFDSAKLSAYSTATNARAIKAISEAKTKLPVVKLNDEQKKEAAGLAQILPPGLASLAAAAPSSNPPVGLGIGKTANLDKLPPATQKKVAEAIKAGYSKNGTTEVQVVDEEPSFKMPSMGESAVADNGAEVLSFAEKALDKADVSNTPDTPIFDIISNRYRKSGWNKVEGAENKAQ